LISDFTLPFILSLCDISKLSKSLYQMKFSTINIKILIDA
jgi:hypothetical protein